MSRAFVKEEDSDAPVQLADRPISTLSNYMTQAGHEQMTTKLHTLQQELDRVNADEGIQARNRQAELQRDIRYFNARLESAEVVKPIFDGKTVFGCTVSFTDDNAAEYRFQIVGEDEADAKNNKISWASPLAKALLGAREGDIRSWNKASESVDIEITKIIS